MWRVLANFCLLVFVLSRRVYAYFWSFLFSFIFHDMFLLNFFQFFFCQFYCDVFLLVLFCYLWRVLAYLCLLVFCFVATCSFFWSIFCVFLFISHHTFLLTFVSLSVLWLLVCFIIVLLWSCFCLLILFVCCICFVSFLSVTQVCLLHVCFVCLFVVTRSCLLLNCLLWRVLAYFWTFFCGFCFCLLVCCGMFLAITEFLFSPFIPMLASLMKQWSIFVLTKSPCYNTII